MKNSTQQKINSIKKDIKVLDNQIELAKSQYSAFNKNSNESKQTMMESAFAGLELSAPFNVVCRTRSVELRTDEDGYNFTLAELRFEDTFMTNKITPVFKFNGGRNVDVLDAVFAFGNHVKMVDTDLVAKLEAAEELELETFISLRGNLDALDLQRSRLKDSIKEAIKADIMSQLLSEDGYTPLKVENNTSSNWSRTHSSTLKCSYGMELRSTTNVRIDRATPSGKTLTLSVDDMFGRNGEFTARLDKVEDFIFSEVLLLEKSELLGHDLIPNVVVK